VEEKYMKVKIVYTSSSHITSLCNETKNGMSCGRERVEGGDICGREVEGRYDTEVKGSRWT
jgi:hypothetical protein